MQLIKPRPESLEDGLFLLETKLFAFFILARMFLVDTVLYPKEAVTVLYTLNGRLAVIELLSFWNSIDEISADM